MSFSLIDKVKEALINWLMYEEPMEGLPLCDFERIQYELRPCDVILIEGRSRISETIKMVTQSTWSHAALYIGRLHDVDDPALRQRISEFYKGSPEEQLLIESLLGKGTIISPLSNYRHDHIRICRPKGISRQDAQRVIGFAINRLGTQYGIRHFFDLARFLLPWGILPRRWRSSLFEYNVNAVPTHEICSFMLADAFASVHFPLLPLMRKNEKGVQLYRRNPRLYTPSDFDYSPYFEIIKYPIFELGEHRPAYRNLPWNEQGLVSNDEAGLIDPNKPLEQKKKKFSFGQKNDEASNEKDVIKETIEKSKEEIQTKIQEEIKSPTKSPLEKEQEK